jgi:DNA-binding response OmpR family regulator
VSQTPYRILAIDSDAAFLAQLEVKLSSAGYQVKTLRDPMRLVPEATAFAPDLVLMDRVLPVLTGAECVRALRAFPATAHLPVVFVITQGSENDVVRSIQAGAVDVLRKPLLPSHLPRIASLCQEWTQRWPSGSGPLRIPPAEALLALYRRDRRNGTLLLNPGTPFEGRAVFVNGEFSRAEYGPLGGPDALEEMLLVQDGAWRLQSPGVRRSGVMAMIPKPPAGAPEPAEPDDGPTPVPHAPATGERPPYRPRVLIVDDDTALRHLFKAQLTQGGFDVEVAEDGLRALSLATARPFDCVVSDLNMPRLDGWALLEKLKMDQRTREVPVIILSAQDDYREMLRIARAGAHDYLAKTGHAEDVISRVMSLLSPRINFELVLESGLPVGGISLAQLGPQWLLRSLARNEVTGTLHLEEEWGEYHLALDHGEPVAAKARSGKRVITGMAAVASLILSRNGEGTFYPGPAPTGPVFGCDMEALLRRTCEALNALDANVVERKLQSGAEFEVDAALYELYRRLAPDPAVRLARALCEERQRPDEIARTLSVNAQQVTQGAIELLHRGIIRFTAEG